MHVFTNPIVFIETLIALAALVLVCYFLTINRIAKSLGVLIHNISILTS